MTPASLRRPMRRALAALLMLAVPSAGQAQTVGTAGAANKLSSGTPPGQGTRTIDIGTQLVRNEKVATSASGSIQVVFIDRTSLNVGPNSTMVIDEFVYNPSTATGKMTLSLAKGVLRVVGGQATHTGGATVVTEAATIGIRGGIATVAFCPTVTANCRQLGLKVTNHFGQITVTTRDGATQTITRPGFTVSVGLDGGPPSVPIRLSQADVDADNATLTSGRGQTGGSTAIPTDTTARAAGLGRTDAALTPAVSVPRQRQTVAVAQASVLNSTLPELTTTVAKTVQTAIEQPATSIAAGLPTSPAYPTNPKTQPSQPTEPTGPTQPTQPATNVTYASQSYALTTTVDSASLGQSQVPYLLASVAGQGTWNVSQVLGYRAGVTQASTAGTPTSRFLQAGINVNGTGTGQNSGLLVATGDITYDNKYGNTLVGGFDATTRLSSTSGVTRSSGSISSPANTTSPSAGSVPVDTDGLPTGSFAVNQNGFATSNSGDVHIYNATNAGTSTGSSYQYNQTISRVATPTGLGADHPALTLNGYVGGLAQTTQVSASGAGTSNPAFIITNVSGQAGDVSIVLPSGSSHAGATFNLTNATPTNGDALTSATFNFGYLNSGDDGTRGTYVDRSNFGARSERTFTASNGSYTSGETSTINGQTVTPNTSTDNFHLAMVTSDTVLGTSSTVHTSSLFPGVSFCACDYTKWGFWSERGSQTASDGSAKVTAANLAFWVAGLPSGASNIPLTGTASYTGHVIANISNGGAQYLTAGNLSTTVNFGTNSGAVAVAGLDGSNYGGSITANSANRAAFGATLTGLNPTSNSPNGRTLGLAGSYFQSAAGAAAELGGTATLRGSNYLGGGIFLAHQTPAQ